MTDEQKKWYRVNLSVTGGEMRMLWKIGTQLMEKRNAAPPSVSRLIRLCIYEAAAARGIKEEE